MRSFSILVIAWFFACLVSVEGVELDGALRGAFMPRLRYNHKRKVVRMDLPNELSAGVGTGQDTNQVNGSIPKNNNQKRNSRNANKKDVTHENFISKLRHNLKTGVLNAFYPPVGLIPDVRKYKYTTSHYEVNLGIVDRGAGSSLTPSQEAFYAETNPAALSRTVRLGGVKFHNAVRQAAYKANKEFLNDASLVAIDDLCSVFYNILYNSRQLYSLLCTALRCQQMVNAVDEDGVYLNPIFAKHHLELPTLDPSDSTPVQNGWQTYVGLDVMAGLVTRHSSSYVTFSDPVSNAWWNQLWGNALNYIKLPQRWMTWCEQMFSYVHLIEPTDDGIYPKFVVFWPDSKFLKLNNGTPTFDYLGSYIQHNSNSVFVDNASLTTDLAPYVDEIAMYFNSAMQTFPQLEIMFKELKCSHSTLSLDINRDITARTVRLNRSTSVEKLVYCAALPFYAAMGTNHSGYLTYRTDYARSRTKVPRSWVTIDPGLVNNTLTNGTRVEISRATFTYQTFKNFTEMDYIALNNNIAPLSFEAFSDLNLSGSRYLRYISAPLLSMSEYGNVLDDLVVSARYSSTFMLQTIVTAFDDLFHIKSNLKVLPRSSFSVDDLGNPTTSAENTALEYGYFPLELNTSNMIDDEINLSVRDYLVPEITQFEAVDEYSDFLAMV